MNINYEKKYKKLQKEIKKIFRVIMCGLTVT
jgi:hypothetical protein